MSPEMLMQPFEQSYNNIPNEYYYQYNTNLMMDENDNMYYLGYPHMDPNEDFRTAFYNPFEIKHRRRTSRAQLKVLEKSFEENPKPNAAVRRILAQQLDMTPRGVQIWFQNRRAKAKLQRRKSGEEEGSRSQSQEYDSQDQHSPSTFSSFFNSSKNWDNNARSIATAAAASCMFESPVNVVKKEPLSPSVKMDEWLKLPIHPLAPVIDNERDFDLSGSHLMDSDDWRRKSCPTLSPKHLQQQFSNQLTSNLSWPSNNNNGFNVDNRRMTADDISASHNRFVQSNSMLKQSTPETQISSECNTPNWGKSSSSHMDMYPNMNYSPLSQQLTPMLSTGSPVPSVDGNYYDSCLDLLMTTSVSSSV